VLRGGWRRQRRSTCYGTKAENLDTVAGCTTPGYFSVVPCLAGRRVSMRAYAQGATDPVYDSKAGLPFFAGI